MPLVSIIINNYNYSRFLKEAIDSALAQTYNNTEVIVVDDGSADESKDIIASYGEKIIPVLKQNGGQASAFNAGLKISKGDIIYHLDADDVVDPSAIEQAVIFFEESSVVKVHWNLLHIDEVGNETREVSPNLPLSEGDLLEEFLQSGPGGSAGFKHCPPTSGNLWSRRYLEQVSPIPELIYKTHADYYLLVLAAIFGEIRKVEKPLAYYRIHGSNDTNKPLEAYIQLYFGWFEHSCKAAQEFLSRKGINVDGSKWPRDTWFHQIYQSIIEINEIVGGRKFILVDDDQWRTDTVMGECIRIPFMEKDGMFWGQPPDDDTAISEIERQRGIGATHIFFAWPAFWWLKYYTKMTQYLSDNYNCVLENNRLIGFSIDSKTYRKEKDLVSENTGND